MDEKNKLNQKTTQATTASEKSVFSGKEAIEPVMTTRRSAAAPHVSQPVSAPRPVSRETVSRPKTAGSGAVPNTPSRTQTGMRQTANRAASSPTAPARTSPVGTSSAVRPQSTGKTSPVSKMTSGTPAGKKSESTLGSGFSTISYQRVRSSGISQNPNSQANARMESGTARPTPQGKNLPAVRTAQTSAAVSSGTKKRPAVSDDVVYLEPGLIGNENDSLKKRKERGEQTNSTLSSLIKAIMYIVFILVVSGFLSYFGISAGNDVFALMKADVPTSVTISDATTIDQLAELLKKENIIRYPSIFRLYAMLRKDEGIEKGYVGGTYTVSPANNYDTLLDVFKGPKMVAQQVRITIPEGYTVDDIINLFVEEYSMGTREGFINTIQYYDFDYWFVQELSELPEGRKYRLEGYLYPDTYYFYSTWSEARILSKILDNFDAKFDERYIARCQEIGMTVDQVVTLASMIQMEAKYDIEYANVSSVFHNRLNNPYQTGGKLQSDATIQYVLDSRHEELTVDDLNLDSRYNTYMYAGLPAGPITNPTTVAINYALFPAKTSYYYFVAQKNGYTLFASTLAEHEANKLAVKNQG